MPGNPATRMLGMPVRSARPPARWAAIQERFQAVYDTEAATFEHTEVFLRWWTVRNDRSGSKLRRIGNGIFTSLTKGTAAGWFDGTYVALFHPEAEPGTSADLVLEVPAGTFPEPEGYGEAILVGEHLANGACALDLDDLGVTFPKAPPMVRRAGVPVA